jgi:hypothetical protein
LKSNQIKSNQSILLLKEITLFPARKHDSLAPNTEITATRSRRSLPWRKSRSGGLARKRDSPCWLNLPDAMTLDQLFMGLAENEGKDIL